MKEFFTYLAMALAVIIGSIMLLAISFSPVKADEKPSVTEDCSYVPKQSDQVRYECDFTNANGVRKVLKGEGEVRVWICGKKYTIEIDCK